MLHWQTFAEFQPELWKDNDLQTACEHFRTSLLPQVANLRTMQQLISPIFDRSGSSMWMRSLTIGAFVCCALCCLSTCAEIDKAINIQGLFEDNFAGQHHNSGYFMVNAWRSNALVDVTFENGYRQVVGTDGQDSYIYIPSTVAGQNSNTVSTGMISYGRFPTNAHLFVQVLWLACVSDAALMKKLKDINMPFFERYKASQFRMDLKLTPPPYSGVHSIKWYAPGYIVPPRSTNQYKLTLYPNGWLADEIVVDRDAEHGDIPTNILFVHFRMQAVTNAYQLQTPFHAKSPDDVLPVEIADFQVTNTWYTKPTQSYIPKTPDSTTIIDDQRIGKTVRVASGKWWASKELWHSRERTVNHRRFTLIVIFCISASLMLFVLSISVWRKRLAKKQVTNEK